MMNGMNDTHAKPKQVASCVLGGSTTGDAAMFRYRAQRMAAHPFAFLWRDVEARYFGVSRRTKKDCNRDDHRVHGKGSKSAALTTLVSAWMLLNPWLCCLFRGPSTRPCQTDNEVHLTRPG